MDVSIFLDLNTLLSGQKNTTLSAISNAFNRNKSNILNGGLVIIQSTFLSYSKKSLPSVISQ